MTRKKETFPMELFVTREGGNGESWLAASADAEAATSEASPGDSIKVAVYKFVRVDVYEVGLHKVR